MSLPYTTKDRFYPTPNGQMGRICREIYIPDVDHPVLSIGSLDTLPDDNMKQLVDIRVFTFQGCQIEPTFYKNRLFEKTTLNIAEKKLFSNISIEALICDGRQFRVMLETRGISRFLDVDYYPSLSKHRFVRRDLLGAIKLIILFQDNRKMSGTDWFFDHSEPLDKSDFKIIENGVVCDAVEFVDGYEVHYFSGKGQIPLYLKKTENVMAV